MFETAVLCDLRSGKIVASHTFLKTGVSDAFIQELLEKYYEIAPPEKRCVTLHMTDKEVVLCRVGPTMLLAGISSTEFTTADIAVMDQLTSGLADRIKESRRIQQEDFQQLVDELLRESIKFCFITSEHPSPTNNSGIAIQRIFEVLHDGTSPFTKPINVGPFRLQFTRYSIDDFERGYWYPYFREVSAFAIVISEELNEANVISEIVLTIRNNSIVPIIVIPASNEYLELARQIEAEVSLSLCDSVSSDPLDLILSILPIAGFTETHDELARRTWVLPEAIGPDLKTVQETPTGNQAFFVVNRDHGTAEYIYYYESESYILRVAPNVISAISMFKLDMTDSTSTAVFQLGSFNYILIEKEGLIFSLVTGDFDDVGAIRERFSNLPDLYFEDPPPPLDDPMDLYQSPPFTLKLLATLPPFELTKHHLPVKRSEPDWMKIKDPLVRTFLQTLWKSIDNTKKVGDFLRVSESGLVVGAIHLLHRMGCIDLQIKLEPDDIPVLQYDIPANLYTVYSHLGRVVPHINGKNSIMQIASIADIDVSVLLMVFTDLLKRGVIDLIPDKSHDIYNTKS